jgi:excinuclease ABC subunit C
MSIVFIRGGRNLGSTNFFPKPGIAESGELLNSFLAQYYLAREVPDEILVDRTVEDLDLLQATLAQHAGHEVTIRNNVRGQRARWLEMAHTNATLGLRMKLSSNANMSAQLHALAEALQLPKAPERMECFDISHTMGEATVASCVVFGLEGPLKSHYRRFNIDGLAPGDDYGALRQAITRRYTRIKRGEVAMPDVLFIDGGPSQLAVATEVLQELEIADIRAIGVAKGADRRPGQERLFLAGQELPTILPPDSPALHLIQRIRDEAHRFAITGHRQRRAKARKHSVLESVPGLGPRKRREVLRQFGGLQGVARASAEDLAKVHGISPQLAELIFASLHPA